MVNYVMAQPACYKCYFQPCTWKQVPRLPGRAVTYSGHSWTTMSCCVCIALGDSPSDHSFRCQGSSAGVGLHSGPQPALVLLPR